MGENYTKKSRFQAHLMIILLAFLLGFILNCQTKNFNHEKNYAIYGDSTNAQLKGSDVFYRDTTGSADRVFISGDFCYVAAESSGLAIINITDPRNPGDPIYKDTDGTSYDVCVEGDYAFIADGDKGLAVFDISNSTGPGDPIYCDTSAIGAAYGICVDGDYAYIAEYLGLAIINITIPTSPSLVVLKSLGGPLAVDVFVDGDFCYLACDNAGLAVINVTDPTQPSDPVFCDTTSAAGIFVEGDHAYLADGSAGLAILNISNPMDPKDPVWLKMNGSANDVFISGDFAYLACGFNLGVVNISDPSNPQNRVYQPLIAVSRGVYVSGEYAFLACSLNGLEIVEIGEIVSPQPEYYTSLNGAGKGIFVSGDFAYVAEFDSGFEVMNISNPSNPVPCSYDSTNGDAYEIFVAGNYAYLATTTGLDIFNITDPTDPDLSCHVDTGIWAYGLFIKGNYAYLAEETGLRVINITIPSQASSISSIIIDYPKGVYIAGDYAYVAAAVGLTVVNVTDPNNLTIIAERTISGPCEKISISGDFAYFAAQSSGLAIVNITDPTNPGFPIYRDTASYAFGLFISGNHAYISDFAGGLAVINITIPTNPGTPVVQPISGNVFSVYVSGDFAFLAGSAGMVGRFFTSQIMKPWYVLNKTSLNSISPNPDYDESINLSWNYVPGATEYYIYRDTAPITTMTGKTPIKTVSINNYQDNVTVNNTYYYVVSAGNDRGKSVISNCQSVNITIDKTPPGAFSIYSPIDWISDQAPSIIGKFNTGLSGVDVSTVNFSYSKVGSSTPTNWQLVNGIYLEPELITSAVDGSTGWLYVQVSSVPFDQDSDVLNTIRFQAADMVGNQGTQNSASIIRVDTHPPQINVVNASGYYCSAPTILVNFTDTYTLDDAYYKIDSNIPGGTNIIGWTAIFTNNTGNDTQSAVTIPNWNLLTEGSHVIYFKSWDDAVNVNDSFFAAWQFHKDVSIGAPLNLRAEPSGWSRKNSFNLTWINPSDLSGIAGVYYKLDALPTSNDDGTFLSGTNISWILALNVTGKGMHTVYVWLVDAAGNVDYNKYSSVNIYLGEEITLFPSFGENPFNLLILTIIIGAIAAVIVVSAMVYRTRTARDKDLIKSKLKTKKRVELKSIFPEQMSLEEKIEFLKRNEISINDVNQLNDPQLNELVNQSFIKYPQEFREKIMNLDIPMEDKMEILGWFNNLPSDIKKEFLKGLDKI